jgi:hypothetical protein
MIYYSGIEWIFLEALSGMDGNVLTGPQNFVGKKFG